MYNLVQTGHLSKKKRSGYASAYFRKRLKKIGEILHIRNEEITKENVHELRLEIKKVKALFTLLRYIDSDFPRQKYYKPFKTIFESAGAIRSIQVEQELLKEYVPDSSDQYLDTLQNLTNKKRKDLKKTFNAKSIARLKGDERKITPFLKEITKKRVRHFLKSNAIGLIDLLEKGIYKEQNLHVIRKKLKRFYLIANMTYENMTIPDPWNRLLDLLGKWHDEQVAVEHLRKAIYSSRFSQDEVNRLYKVKREITENRENLFDEIVATFFLIESKEGSTRVPDKSVVSQIQ